VDKHFIYPVCILLLLILQKLHARIYKVHIHIHKLNQFAIKTAFCMFKWSENFIINFT